MKPVLAVRGVSFAWPGTEGRGLCDVQFSLVPGERVFIHGASGSGKSTLLNLLAGVLTPQSGEIEMLAQPFSRLSARQRDGLRARHMGVLFQQFNLLPYLSVLDNVLLPCRFSPERAQRAGEPLAAARRLLAALDIAPDLQGRKARQLSVGQQQRVAAARALIGQPELILADEPTSALDSARQAAFMALLLEQSQRSGCALVLVSHDLSLQHHFSQVLELPS